MKRRACKIFLIFAACCISVTAQQTPEKSDLVDLNDILSKLTFTSRISKSAEQINEELTKLVRERKVNFVLGSENEKQIKDAGGNDQLIEAIRENFKGEVKTLTELPAKTSSDKAFEENATLYSKITKNYKGNLEQMKIALEAAIEYVASYSGDETFKLQVKWVSLIAIPGLNATIKEIEFVDPTPHGYSKFNKAFKEKKWDELFEAGAEILNREPEYVDVALILASVGFETKKSKYRDKTLYYAEKAIELLDQDKKYSDNFGAFNFEYKTKEFPDGKANALGWMNYIIGYIKYFDLGQKAEAIQYFQKSLTYQSGSNVLVRQLKLVSEPEE